VEIGPALHSGGGSAAPSKHPPATSQTVSANIACAKIINSISNHPETLKELQQVHSLQCPEYLMNEMMILSVHVGQHLQAALDSFIGFCLNNLYQAMKQHVVGRDCCLSRYESYYGPHILPLINFGTIKIEINMQSCARFIPSNIRVSIPQHMSIQLENF
jgi:hypothetical protein